MEMNAQTKETPRKNSSAKEKHFKNLIQRNHSRASKYGQDNPNHNNNKNIIDQRTGKGQNSDKAQHEEFMYHFSRLEPELASRMGMDIQEVSKEIVEEEIGDSNIAGNS